MGRTFVLDTNVLLYDAESPLRYREGTVVFTGTILEELDHLKKNMDELGRNARSILRLLDQHMLEGNCKDGLNLRIVLDVGSRERGRFPLSLERPSHRILATAHWLQEQGEDVVFISKDPINRVKAQSLGIPTEGYENLKIAYERMLRGVQSLNVDRALCEQLAKDGKIAFPGCDTAGELLPNQYFELHAEDGYSTLARYNPRGAVLEVLSKLPRDVWGLQPLNNEQRCALDLLLRDEVNLVALIGQAGTGKTLLALAAAMRKVFDDQTYNKILVSRPIVPLGKDIGYLPGSKEEKLSHWMQPIYDNLEFLCQSTGGQASGAETMGWLMESNKIEMEAVTYIRGRSLPKMFIIVDEAQNLTPHEIKTIISRAGAGTKVVLTGDPSQIDNPYLDRDSNGLSLAVSRFREHAIFGHIHLQRTERSALAALAAEAF